MISENPVKSIRILVKKYLVRIAVFVSISFYILACSKIPEGIGQAVKWSDLSGWSSDQQSKIWPALLQSCKALSHRKAAWKMLCTEATRLNSPDDGQARKFFEQYFVPHRIFNNKGTASGVVTGYFVPTLLGSNIRDNIYKHAIYSRPPNMITVNLKSLYPSKLAGMRLRGKIKGTRLTPFFSRKQIDAPPFPLKGHEIVWVKDPIALFFMHIQGSGYIKLTDGKVITVGYADQNGHPYVPVGRVLVKTGAIPLKEISLQSIRQWMIKNPTKQQTLMNHNPSYIFFHVLPSPLGSLGVPLTDGRSIAVDRRQIPLGSPVWVDTSYPEIKTPGASLKQKMSDSKMKLRRLFMAQDTGGAISGAVRADVFWGKGDDAKQLAGHMNQKGKMYVLVPKKQKNQQ